MVGCFFESTPPGIIPTFLCLELIFLISIISRMSGVIVPEVHGFNSNKIQNTFYRNYLNQNWKTAMHSLSRIESISIFDDWIELWMNLTVFLLSVVNYEARSFWQCCWYEMNGNRILVSQDESTCRCIKNLHKDWLPVAEFKGSSCD